jgi:tRNA threonylcarbamoyladenosine biosynthesis protein TsaE
VSLGVHEILLVGPPATEQLGEAVGRRLQRGQGVALRGELGMGKTCLARGIARGLGVDAPDEVCSPTYLLVMEHPGPVPLLHVDAYLPGKTRVFLAEGGLDYLTERAGVVVVEWAERVADLLPEETLWIDLVPARSADIESRIARLSAPLPRAFPWISELPVRFG